jgi:hypothetical protein
MAVYSAYGLTLDTSSFAWTGVLSGEDAFRFHACICLTYIISVWILTRYVGGMSKEAKVQMRANWGMDTLKYWHNVSLSVVSGLMGVIMIYCISKDGRLSGGWKAMACQNTPNQGLYGFANFVYLVSKIWEWVDTYWLVLYDKPVISLHAFHHMTTFSMAAFTHNFPVGGYAFINCLVHLVMYMHYANPVRWARPFITSFQLLQFVAVITIHTYGYVTPAPECFDMSTVTYEWYYCQLVVVGYFLMFCKFFADNYVKPPKKPKMN